MKEPTLAQRQRMAILLALADWYEPNIGLTVSQIASTTPWAPAALYTALYALEREGLVGVNRRHIPIIAALVEHPDLAAMDAQTVPDD
jgi:hypothetical protein